MPTDDLVPTDAEAQVEDDAALGIRPAIRFGQAGELIQLAAIGPGEHLLDQRWHHVDRGVRVGMVGKHVRHVEVVFGRVQPQPGQADLAGAQIAIERLVHVPDDGDVEGMIGHVLEVGSWKLEVGGWRWIAPTSNLQFLNRPHMREQDDFPDRLLVGE